MGAYENSSLGARVSGSDLPEGFGISAHYPGDKGIEKDPAVVFAEDFEVKDLAELQKCWSELVTYYPADARKSALTLDVGAPPGSLGATCLRITATKGADQGGQAYKGLRPGYDRLFLRFYTKFADDYGYCHHFSGLGGEVVAPARSTGAAGVKPVDRWVSLIDAQIDYRADTRGNFLREPPPGNWHFYSYWPDMRSYENEDGTSQNPDSGTAYYGNSLNPVPAPAVVRGKWICLEMMVKMNSSPEKSDGEQALWIDGKLAAYFAPGSIKGNWYYDTFIRDEKGKPFEGFRWRIDPRVNVNKVRLENYVTDDFRRYAEAYSKKHPDFHINGREDTVWFDHVVVSKEYVGPLKPAEGK